MTRCLRANPGIILVHGCSNTSAEPSAPLHPNNVQKDGMSLILVHATNLDAADDESKVTHYFFAEGNKCIVTEHGSYFRRELFVISDEYFH